MSDWVFAVALILVQVVAWLLARVIVRAVPSVARARQEWESVDGNLSAGDRRRIRQAVNRGQATDEPRLRSYAVSYAENRLSMLGGAESRRSWATALGIAVLVEFGVVVWLAVVRNEVAGAVVLAVFVLLLVLIVVLAFKRRPRTLLRAIEANGGGRITRR
jgi:hypothetical protein